jgi:putative phosphoribosyl transferase
MGALHIISLKSVSFGDRIEAGKLLAEQLTSYSKNKPVVLGIPRGGIVVARSIAHSLKADMDIILAHKLRAPDNPELAIGSVSENGKLFLNELLVSATSTYDDYIQHEKSVQMAEIRRRINLFRHVRTKIPLVGRTVILTDDGVATGSTFQAALWGIRAEKPEKLIAALPVGPEDTMYRLAKDCDETICLSTPPFFTAVSQFYVQFEPVEDEEVLQILKEAQKQTIK